LLNDTLSNPKFWNNSGPKTYTGRTYDEIRVKKLKRGYVPAITGQGDSDYSHELITDVVFAKQDRLPTVMEGAKAVVYLGEGFDEVVGAPYHDAFFVLDLTFFYAYYPQRMYRVDSPNGERSYLYYEKLDQSFVSTERWDAYQTVIEKTKQGLDLRGYPFNGLIEVEETYGLFLVNPGETKTTRITFLTKMTFARSANFLARWGSKMPGVLRTGLKTGFAASVKVAQVEKKRRAALAPPAPAAPAETGFMGPLPE